LKFEDLEEMTSNTPTSASSGSSTKVDCTRASQNVWLVKVSGLIKLILQLIMQPLSTKKGPKSEYNIIIIWE